VSATFHLVTGEYPPQVGGVGDYTAKLAGALARRGSAVHVWSPAVRDAVCGGVTVHALPDRFGGRSRQTLAAAFASRPGRVIIQYVPNAFGRRGANLPFCRWVARLRGRDVDVRVMFHEPYFYFTAARPLANVLAVAQRAMAALLLRGGGVTYVSTDSWIGYLRRYAPADTSWSVLPIPATAEGDPPGDAIERWRRSAGGGPIVGHFGSYGDDVAQELAPVLIALLSADEAVRVLLVGRNSGAFADKLLKGRPECAGRVHASGVLPQLDVVAALKACAVLVQPFPDGVTTRRTSVMAGLAAGVATVTTSGRLTERVWRDSDAAVLVPAGSVEATRDAALGLLRNPLLRQDRAAAGKRVYGERFAIDRSVDVLTGA
jgi:glycosyltransferase involved in cell wall biosynthesis